MKLKPLQPPRVFRVGLRGDIEMRHVADIDLSPDELVTFRGPQGTEFDVTRKDFGYYALTSLNGRLVRFGLRPALTRNGAGLYYLLLVGPGEDARLEAYLAAEEQSFVRWLDEPTLASLTPEGTKGVCPMCGGSLLSALAYDAPPPGEIAYSLSPGVAYRRAFSRCVRCGHFLSDAFQLLESFYAGSYVDVTYGDMSGVQRQFERIVALPPDRSDNAGRVARVDAFVRARLGSDRTGEIPPRLLDVGSGLCVFAHAMRGRGWDCVCLDMDPRQVAHAERNAGVRAYCGTLPLREAREEAFDCVSFNKVLEHVSDPVVLLGAARHNLTSGGIVYVEVPDGEEAIAEGPSREEFFIEHLHVFSMASLVHLARRCGLTVITTERLREPSGKFVLSAFLRQDCNSPAVAGDKDNKV